MSVPDAVVENIRLRQDIEDLEKKYDEMVEAYQQQITELRTNLRELSRRCYVLTEGHKCSYCLADCCYRRF